MNRATMRTQIRQLADMVYSSFVDDTTELNPWIDQSTEDLYDILLEAYGDEYWSQVCWINISNTGSVDASVAWPNVTFALVDSGDSPGAVVLSSPALPLNGYLSSFALPLSFLRPIRVSYVRGTVSQTLVTLSPGPDLIVASQWSVITSDSDHIPIHRIDTPGQSIGLLAREWQQGCVRYRTRRGPHRIVTGTTGAAFETLFDGTVIEFLPIPKGQYAVQVTYVKRPMLLTDDATDFHYDFVGWVLNDVAAKCIEKQEADSSACRNRQAVIEARIKSYARLGDAANPPMVVDVHSRSRLADANSEPLEGLYG